MSTAFIELTPAKDRPRPTDLRRKLINVAEIQEITETRIPMRGTQEDATHLKLRDGTVYITHETMGQFLERLTLTIRF